MFNGLVLRTLRIKKHFSCSEIIFELDKVGLRISRPTILNWELGKTEPKASQIYKISKFFDIPMEKFYRD